MTSKRLKSLWLFALITVSRVFDHAWRFATGLPTIKRSLITPQLYLGGQYGFHAISALKQLGVTGIVNMRIHSIHRDKAIEGIKILHLPTPDRKAPTQQQLQEGVAFIKNEIDHGGKVYIHCKYGEGRGPTMVIAYLISTGLLLDDAIAQVKLVRPFINPRSEQLAALKVFSKKIASQK